MAALSRQLAVLMLMLGSLLAQARDQRTATVGMRAYLEQVVLPGTELQPAPSTLKTPLVLRVLKTWPHGNALRYDFEWVGLAPGSFDLCKFLVRQDGSAVTDLPEVMVEATSTLAKDAFEPTEIEPEAPRRLNGYRAMQIAAGIAWGLGLLAILFVGRRFRKKVVTVVSKPTLADRLRPLVEAVVRGDAETAAKAELERLLLAFWRARLNLEAANAADAIVAIKQHAEAGALLRQLEAWLHMPTPPAPTDVSALLAPYRSVTAESFEPIAQAGVR